MLNKQFSQKVSQLRKKHRVPVLKGAFYNKSEDLNSVETFIHEVAHWVTMGNSVSKIPSRLEEEVSKKLDGMTRHSTNSLEIDTSLVTYLVGRYLDLWEVDPLVFIQSCGSNLRLSITELSVTQRPQLNAYVKQEFQTRLLKDRYIYWMMAKNIAKWLKPSLKTKANPEIWIAV